MYLKVKSFCSTDNDLLAVDMEDWYKENPGIGIAHFVVLPHETTNENGDPITLFYAWVHYIEQSNLQVVKPGA